MIELARKPTGELHLVDRGLELRGGRGCLGHKLGSLIALELVGELKSGGGVRQALARGLNQLHVFPAAGELLHNGAGRVGVIPKAGFGAPALKLGHTQALLVHMQVLLNLGEALGKRRQVGLRHDGALVRRCH